MILRQKKIILKILDEMKNVFQRQTKKNCFPADKTRLPSHKAPKCKRNYFYRDNKHS